MSKTDPTRDGRLADRVDPRSARNAATRWVALARLGSVSSLSRISNWQSLDERSGDANAQFESTPLKTPRFQASRTDLCEAPNRCA
jgi:hypothetical protein